MSGLRVPTDTARLGAFRGWPNGHTGQAWTAVMETTSLSSLDAAVRQCELFGVVRSHGEPCECHAVLDALDADGNYVDDWCIPTVEAFAKVAALLNLRCTSWDAMEFGGTDRPGVLRDVQPGDTEPRWRVPS